MVRISLLFVFATAGFLCASDVVQAMEVNGSRSVVSATDSCRSLLISDMEDEFGRFPDWKRNVGNLKCTTLNTHYMSADGLAAIQDKSKALLAALYRGDCGRFMFRFLIRERGRSGRWRDVGSGCVDMRLDVSEADACVSVLNEQIEGYGVKFKASVHGGLGNGGRRLEICVSHFNHRDVCYYRIETD